MNKYIVLVVLIVATAFAWSLPVDKSKILKRFPKIPKCVCIKAPCPCAAWTEESDIAWVPAAIWAGKAIGAGALGAAGAHAYDKIFRRKDSVESDIAWVPAAIWAGKAIGAGALGAAGKHAYEKIFRRKDSAQSDIAWVPAAIWAGKAIGAGALGAAGAHAYDKIFRRNKRDSVESDIPIGALFTAYNLYKKFKKDNVESDIAWVPVAIWAGKAFGAGVAGAAGKHAYDKFIRRRDSVQSDAEFGKFLKKVGGIAKKGFAAYQKVKGLGFFADRFSWSDLKKYATKENLQKAISIYKTLKNKSQSDNFFKKAMNWWNTKGKNYWQKGKEIYAVLKNKKQEQPESDKIDWSKVKKYLTPENLQKAVDIWKVLKNKDNTEADFYGAAAKWLGQKALEQAGKFGYNKIFRRKDEAEEQVETPKKPAKKGVTLKGLVAKLRKQQAQAKDGKTNKKFDLKKLLAKIQKKRAEKKESKDGEKPKRKFDIKALIAKIQKKRGEKKQKKEKKSEKPAEENPQASG